MSIGSGQRRDVDDVSAAALLQQRNCFVTAVEDTAEVCLDHSAKIVGAHRFDRREHADTRIVDEDINAAKPFDSLSEECLDLSFVTNVAEKAGGSPGTRFVKLCGHTLDLALVSRSERNVHPPR